MLGVDFLWFAIAVFQYFIESEMLAPCGQGRMLAGCCDLWETALVEGFHFIWMKGCFCNMAKVVYSRM